MISYSASTDCVSQDRPNPKHANRILSDRFANENGSKKSFTRLQNLENMFDIVLYCNMSTNLFWKHVRPCSIFYSVYVSS